MSLTSLFTNTETPELLRPKSSMASTRTSSISPRKYDVFLSFRGEDTRKTFTDHLYTELVCQGILTFRDNEELEMGGVIAPELQQAIQESRVSIIIFSENYASSRWCLDELVKILECQKITNQIVVPVFYHVDPSEVRKQTGSFGEAFIRHEMYATQEESEKIQRWRETLTEIGNISGLHVQDQYESKIIQDIVRHILPYLPTPLNVGTHLVGVDKRLQELLHLMSIRPKNVRMVGIFGFGGVGKSTIAKAIYNELSNQFMYKSFLEKVGDASKVFHGLLDLQKQLYSDISLRGRREIRNLAEGSKVLQKRLSCEKVLLVIDDVNNEEQLNNLAGGHDWFGEGSIIIITCRDRSLIAQRVDIEYELGPLTGEAALELFSWHALNVKHPSDRFYTLANRFVQYCQGLPLALKTLGSFLYQIVDPYKWQRELRKLDDGPNMHITDVLKVSLDGLEDNEKAIFLDIACFFKGEHTDFIIKILDGCGFNAESGIELLRNRCLLTISNGKIDMHNLIQQLGHKIVHDEGPRKKGERSRLWNHMDVLDVLKKGTATSSIQGIFLNFLILNNMNITSQVMENMTELRLFKIFLGSEVVSGGEDYKVYLSSDFEFPSWELCYLYWHGYPLNSLPSNFEAGKLVELHMPYSNITKFGEGNEVEFSNLTAIILSHSKSLIEISNFSSTPNLEKLVLEGCTRLHEIDPSIGDLKRLGLLDLKECKSLGNLPDSICKLKSLKTLYLSGCSELNCLPHYLGNMSHLTELYGDRTNIGAPPSAIGCLTELQILSFSGCKAGRDYGSSFSLSGLFLLRELDLSDCYWWDAEIPEDFWGLYSLKKLNLSGNDLIEVPASITELSMLKVLLLGRCKGLQEIPKLPPSLEELDVHECLSLHIPPMALPSDVVEDISEMMSLHRTILQRFPSSASSSNVVNATLQRIGSLHRTILQRFPSSASSSNVVNANLQRIESLHARMFVDSVTALREFNSMGEMMSRIQFGTNPYFVSLSDFVEAILRTMWLHKTMRERIYSSASSSDVVEKTSKVMSLHKSILGRIPCLASLSDVVEVTSSQMTSLGGTILEGISSLVSSRDGVEAASRMMSLHRTILERIPSLASSMEGTLRLMSWHKTILDRIQASPRSEFCTLIPGDTIPQWFEHQETGSSIRVPLPSEDWYKHEDFVGFCVCFIFTFNNGVPEIDDEIICRLNNFSFFYPYWDKWLAYQPAFHMWLAYQPRSQVDICHPELWNDIQASFEMTVHGATDQLIGDFADKYQQNKCGVQLIYAPGS